MTIKMTAPGNSRLNVVVRSPNPFGLGRNGCWTSRGSQLPRALSFTFSLYSSLSLASAAALLTFPLWHRMRPNLPFLSAASNAILKPADLLRWKKRLVKDARLSLPLTEVMKISDEDRQAYISASRRASSVIAKAKAEAWQTTCSSLSPKSNPKSVYSLLRSIAGSPFSSSSYPNFPNYSSPRDQLWSMPLT